MFTEYLKLHPFRDGLVFPVPCPYPSAEDRAAWTFPDERTRSGLKELIDQWRVIPYPMLTAGQYIAFRKDGSRQAFEKPYFDRRRKLCASLVEYCLTLEPRALEDITDGIWCILEETSWVISAHNEPGRFGLQPLPDDLTPRIDLFSSQTGMILALCCELAGKALDGISPLLRERIGRELEIRILVPFETKNDHWWMGYVRKDLNNWTPWIISNVMLVACLRIREDRARLQALLERACMMLDRYLDVLPEDGGCDEGMGYWNLAGGMLLDCLELLEHATGGKMSFRNDRKLMNVLSYPLHAYLGNGWCVNFADCDARPEIGGERIARAGEMFGRPELISFGSAHQMKLIRHLSDTPQLWRLLNGIFHSLPDTVDTMPEPDVWLPDLQLRSRTRAGVTLIIKAGHNGENHNHNDVGSLMIYKDSEPVLLDAGNMIYTAKTFSSERYTLWNTRSMYHNLPMIAGMEQLPGRNRCAASVRCLPHGLSFDMTSCYPDGLGLTQCFREASVSADGTVVLSDRIRADKAIPVSWVFMTRQKPEIEPAFVRLGPMVLRFPDEMHGTAEEIPVSDPRMAGSYPGSLWRIILNASPAKEHSAEFVFSVEQ